MQVQLIKQCTIVPDIGPGHPGIGWEWEGFSKCRYSSLSSVPWHWLGVGRAFVCFYNICNLELHKKKHRRETKQYVPCTSRHVGKKNTGGDPEGEGMLIYENKDALQGEFFGSLHNR